MDYSSFPMSNNRSSCGSSSSSGGGGEMRTAATATASGKTNKKMKNSRNKGVMKLSTDPQSVAARERRHRISDRFKILQSLVPGGTKMDTVSMLDEAIHYVKFLKTQIWLHQTMINFVDYNTNNDRDHRDRPIMIIPDDYDPNPNYSTTVYPNSATTGCGGSGGGVEIENHGVCTENDVVVDGIEEIDQTFLPEMYGNYLPAGVGGEDQFMCSYDTYMNF